MFKRFINVYFKKIFESSRSTIKSISSRSQHGIGGDKFSDVSQKLASINEKGLK